MELIQFTQFLFGPNRNLNQIIRFNTRQRSYNETVASHIYYVTLYSLILADIANKSGHKIDTERVLRNAILHDVEESSSGDVIRTFKIKMAAIYKKISIIAVEHVFEFLPEKLIDKYVKVWSRMEEWSQSEEPEEVIVDIADELTGILYCTEQICMGNSYFKKIRDNYLEKLEKIVKNTPFEPLYEVIIEKLKDTNLCSYD